MESVWYYVRNGAQAGPVSFDELKAAAASGEIAADGLVWQEGTADWVAARTVAGLFPGRPPAPPPLKLPDSHDPEPLPLDDSPHPRARTSSSSSAADLFALAKLFLSRAIAASPAAITPTPAEEDSLTRAGILDPTARRYAIWRRAMLWVAVPPTSFAALFALIMAMSTAGLSWLGGLMMYLQAMTLVALPVLAVLAAKAYDNPAASAKLIRSGAYVAVGYPLLMAVIPTRYYVDMKGIGLDAGPIAVIVFYLMLMPMVLSLLPAVSRACGRVKTFLPQSLVPGWGLVACVPLLVLLTLIVASPLYQFVLLILGLIVWIGAPLFYLTKSGLLNRPVSNPRDLTSLAKTQLTVSMIAAGGVVLLIISLFVANIIGFDKYDSAVRPWSLILHRIWLEYLGRSLFMTVLFADLLVRMSLSVWREERAFAGTPAAADYDKSMSAIGDAVEGKKG